ncbi:MAG: GntR family transcriptional regulator [Pseudomonadota bacterium]
MPAVIRDTATYPPIRSTSVHVAEIVTALRNEIVSGAIPPGSALGQESLAERFGVSRMPIREAIRHLESMGFVTIEGNKRTRVADLSLDDLIDIYEMRSALEAVAITAAMPNLTNAQIEYARQIQSTLTHADPVEFGLYNQAFHMTLYRPCNRPRLLAQIDTLFNAADRYLCIAKGPAGQRDKSDAEHLELLEICLRRDAEAARACLLRHIGDAQSVFERLP